MVFFRMLKCLAALLLFAAAGTAGAEESGLFERAKKMVADGKAECVVIRGERLFPWNGRGVSPLLEFHDHREPGFLKGATVVDKVIGRAAAAIIVSGGAVRVHGEIMSEDGKAYLEARGIRVTYGTLVPRILNMDRSDLCPLEKAVEGIDDPEQALTSLRKRIEELKAK